MFIPPSLRSTPEGRVAFVEYLKTLGPDDECVYWPWSRVRDTYSHMKIDGQHFKVTRWVYEQMFGPLPSRSGRGATGILVCHVVCDNPPCVNPWHLAAGDNRFNLGDAARKGRMSKGSRNGRAKLTEDDVRRIRSLAGRGVKQVVLVAEYGISQTQMSRIVRGETWVGIGEGEDART